MSELAACQGPFSDRSDDKLDTTLCPSARPEALQYKQGCDIRMSWDIVSH